MMAAEACAVGTWLHAKGIRTWRAFYPEEIRPQVVVRITFPYVPDKTFPSPTRARLRSQPADPTYIYLPFRRTGLCDSSVLLASSRIDGVQFVVG
jgi:hypothetical protein